MTRSVPPREFVENQLKSHHCEQRLVNSMRHASPRDDKAAFECLDRAVSDHAFVAGVVSPDWDKLRLNPRCPPLIERIGPVSDQ